MTTIKKNYGPATIYNKFMAGEIPTLETVVETPHEFVWQFNNTADTISFKLTNTTDDTIEYNFNISYDDIKTSKGYDTQTLFVIKDDAYNAFSVKSVDGEEVNTTEEERATPYNVPKDDLFELTNVTADTNANLDTGNVGTYTRENAFALPIGEVFLRILVPYVNCPVSDLEYIVKVPDNPNLTVLFKEADGTDVANVIELEKTYSAEPGSRGNPEKFFNKITISADNNNPAAGDVVKLTLTSENPKVDKIYVKPISGLVNKTVVNLKNGVGTISIDSDGLDSGDEISVKFGYKYFGNVANFTKTLA